MTLTTNGIAAATMTDAPFGGGSLSALEEAQKEVFNRGIPEELIDILPTGEIYLSQVHYRRILNEAVGQMGWCMKPLSAPQIDPAGSMLIHYGLFIGGRFVSEAWGEANMAGMSLATACESSKSNALSRCCKDLGIASQCWDHSFAEAFKALHCVKVWVNGKIRWRRMDAAPFYGETSVAVDAPAAIGSMPPLSLPPDFTAEDISKAMSAITTATPTQPAPTEVNSAAEAIGLAEANMKSGNPHAAIMSLLSALPEESRAEVLKNASKFPGNDGKDKYIEIAKLSKASVAWVKRTYDKLLPFLKTYVEGDQQMDIPDEKYPPF